MFILNDSRAYFEQKKENSDDKAIAVQIDYSENFTVIEQDIIKSADFFYLLKSNNHVTNTCTCV